MIVQTSILQISFKFRVDLPRHTMVAGKGEEEEDERGYPF